MTAVFLIYQIAETNFDCFQERCGQIRAFRRSLDTGRGIPLEVEAIEIDEKLIADRNAIFEAIKVRTT